MLPDVKLWAFQKKNNTSNINRNLKTTFNNIWFIYTGKKKGWYKNYPKKCNLHKLKYQQKLYNVEIKKPYNSIFRNNIKKKYVISNSKSWFFFNKQLKKKKDKLMYYQNNFNRLYNRNTLYTLFY